MHPPSPRPSQDNDHWSRGESHPGHTATTDWQNDYRGANNSHHYNARSQQDYRDDWDWNWSTYDR